MFSKSKLLKNSLSMLINQLAQSVATFILTAAIARSLGADELGKYLLAFSYYFIFVSLFSQGLKILFIRDLSLNPDQSPFFLINGTILQFLLGLIGYVALVLTVFAFPYHKDTSIICYVMGLAIVPFSLSNITEAIFQAQERMHLIALSTVPVYMVRVLLMILLMQQGYGLLTVATLFVASEFLILFIQWGFLAKSFLQASGKISGAFMRSSLNAAKVFYAIDGVNAISNRSEIIILSLLGSEALVGLYGGVIQLTQPFLIIANSIIAAVFPSFSKAVNLGFEHQRKVAQNVIELLLSLALPICVGLFFFSDSLLLFVYRDPTFKEASTILNLSSLSLIAWAFCRPLGHILMANGLERINMRQVTFDAFLRIILGILLVSKYKLLGAAMTGLLLSFSALAQYIYAAHHHLFKINIKEVFKYPLVITSLMMLPFILLNKLELNFGFSLAILTVTYFVVVGVIGIKAFGGMQAVWIKLSRTLKR